MMALGRKGFTDGALDISSAAHVLRGSREFLRMWSRPGGDATCMIDPQALSPDPAAFGIALVDCARQGAKAWAHATGMSEKEALARMWLTLDAERSNATDLPRPITPEGGMH
jgi:hypothetical protein